MILFRYIVREILVATLAVAFTLLVIVISSRLVAYLSLAAAGNLSPGILASVIAYRIPGFLELILPLAFFVATLLALGRLYVDSEMTVMTACGISPRRVLLMTLVPALLVALIVAAISLYVSPYTKTRVSTLLASADSATGLDLLVAGRFRFIKEGAGRVTYVEQKQGDELLGVFVTDNPRRGFAESRQVVVLAERGRTEIDPETGDQFLVLENGTRYLGQPGALDFQVMDFQRMRQWLQPRDTTVVPRKRDTQPTAALLGSPDPVNIATLQWRVSLALLVLVSTVSAVALARTDHRRGRYGKLLPAFIVFLVYFLALNAARDAVGKERIDAVIGMWWVHGVFLLLGVALLFGGQWLRAWRVRRRGHAG
ncbi:MAG: LPS export ABC transporter permease LptF [Thauera sp.]|nr:LPS export ABC transporter permease LptF [Thauera sp.]